MNKRTCPLVTHCLPKLWLTVAAYYYAHLLNQNIDDALLETNEREGCGQNVAIMLTDIISSGYLSGLSITVMDELFSSRTEKAYELFSFGDNYESW